MKSAVALVCSNDRASGIRRAVSLLGINPVKGKRVLVKPNFNTADPFPGSTHNDTLFHLIRLLQEMGSRTIAVGERSGPPDTADVLREKGIPALCEACGADLVNFEELPADQWVRVKPENTKWRNGFLVARPVIDAECVVATCCLKTHQYGGVFTISLKLGVGITHKKNMTELHTSFRSMRSMIAEINTAYSPALIVVDAIEAFVDGGPMTGTKRPAGMIFAGTDRVAVDAVGLAILKHMGSNPAIMKTRIFDQEQISRAVELGIGVAGPAQIELRADEHDRAAAEAISALLAEG